MMTKLLEKALTDAIKEKKRIIGVKQIIASIKNCKLIVISQSVPTNKAKKIEENAKKGLYNPYIKYTPSDFS